MKPGRSLAVAPILLLVVVALLFVSGVGFRGSASGDSAPIKVGAIYPLKSGGPPARAEYRGLRTALRIVNKHGGIHGRKIQLRLQDVRSGDDAPAAVQRLVREHVIGILGSESSLVGLPASEASQASHTFYLEAGAVATMLTAKGLPDVFRTVTTGQTLGRAAANFAARSIAPRLKLNVRHVRVAVVYIRDVYGESVGAAQIAESEKLGMRVVKVFPYSFPGVNFHRLVRRLKRVHPDVVLVAAYRPDAIAFRRETIKQHMRVGAMIGTSSSFCMMGFARALGRGAVGLFASDKPDASISSRALDGKARRLRRMANGWYEKRYGSSMNGPAVAGFVGGWVFFHTILANATSFSTKSLRKSALSLNLPFGSEISGAGVHFARPSARDGGQNLRASSVIWQWQRPDHAKIIWPRAYSTGSLHFVPLPLHT